MQQYILRLSHSMESRDVLSLVVRPRGMTDVSEPCLVARARIDTSVYPEHVCIRVVLHVMTAYEYSRVTRDIMMSLDAIVFRASVHALSLWHVPTCDATQENTAEQLSILGCHCSSRCSLSSITCRNR